LDEAIHQADQFAHDRDKADLREFAIGAQTLVEGGEAWIAASGDEVELLGAD
jgi:hypothetical protein